MKKGEQPEFSAKWWKSSQPKGLKSAGKLDDALKDYEVAKKKLEAGGDEAAVKTAEDALGTVETAVGAVVSEASKDKKSPEMALTVDVLKKFDRLYGAEQAWIEDHAEKDDDSIFADPDAYHSYLIAAMKKLRTGGQMNFGFVLGKKAEDHRLAVHRSKGSKALANELVKQTGLHAVTCGTAMPDENRAGVLVLVLQDRQLPGMKKKGERMLKKFKPLPFTKLAVLVDGKEVEDLADPDDTDVDAPDDVEMQGAPAGTPDAAGMRGAPAGPSASAGMQAARAEAPDTTALTWQLGALIRRVRGVTDSALRQELVGIATRANAALKAGDLPQVVSAISELRAAIDESPHGVGAQPTSPAGSNGLDPAKVAVFTKARTAWLVTRQKVESDINKLQDEFLSSFKGHAKASDLEKGFRSRVEAVLTSMDEELAHTLDAATKVSDPSQHANLVQNAKQIIQRYENFVARDSTIAALDANPFVPLAIQKTFTATLSVLSKTIV